MADPGFWGEPKAAQKVLQRRKRIEADLEFARRIQLSMVPTEFPAPTSQSPVAIFASLWPFILLQVVVLALVLSFPQVALWLPSLN